MSRYATREDDVDRLLRGRIFVDLHRVVRQGLRASVESYSIKQTGAFYGFAGGVDARQLGRQLDAAEWAVTCSTPARRARKHAVTTPVDAALP